MANRLFQIGNYIIAQRDEGGDINTYEFVKKSAIYLERNEYYDISALGGTAFSIGKAEIATFLDAETGGVAYTESSLLTFLRTYSGFSPSNIGLTTVSTDATLTGDGTPSAPLSVVPNVVSDQERWDILSSPVSNVWNVLTLVGTPVNKTVFITIDPNSNNTTVGVRKVGSTLNRTSRIDRDSHGAFMVKTNSLGQIEVFTSNTNADFQVQMYLNA